jgi:hypothetical protein
MRRAQRTQSERVWIDERGVERRKEKAAHECSRGEGMAVGKGASAL